MIVLYTDFGYQGPYVGQMKAVLHRGAPATAIVDLMHDAPSWDAMASAYLLAALLRPFPQKSVFVAVVDPAVGSARAPVVLQADGRWFVGPDNGLLHVVARRAAEARWWRITWQPPSISASFHGRDLFAPVAAALARGDDIEWLGAPVLPWCPDWPEDLPAVVYVDGFGNVMTGYRALSAGGAGTKVSVGSLTIPWARTFSDVPHGRGFWYENAHGLIELAVNQGSAAEQFGLRPGDGVTITPG